MSVLDARNALRPGPAGVKGWIARTALSAAPLAFRVMRRFMPIARLGSTHIVTRYDDVREVFDTDRLFHVPYKPNLDVITGGEPFFLGMSDGPVYRESLAAMRRVALPEDLPRLARAAEARAEEIVAGSGGRVEVVDQLVRTTAFDLIGRYFGVPEPEEGRLAVWGTRLFEFQFAGSPDDHDLRAQVDEIAPAFRDHIDRVIQRRKAEGAAPPGAEPDVLGRCLERQRTGEAGYSDVEIRTALLCMVVGGPPQPPMVAPQAMEQLLRRPKALAAAAAAAKADDDDRLWRIVREAMRFDPLAPGLPRTTLEDGVVARGLRRERAIPKGSTVIAAFASAMMDERRIPEPRRFDADRLEHEYIHFGHGLHECFGKRINEATLARMLKPLLRRPGLRRAPGAAGRLTKAGVFAERLVVEFDPS